MKKCAGLVLICSVGAMANHGEGMGEIIGTNPVGKIHFVEISRHANPVSAFLRQNMFGKTRAIESKYFAGLREKIQDHHTRSRLYSKNRDSYIRRGLYQLVKSSNEEKDIDKAQSLAGLYLSDFYKQESKNATIASLLDYQADTGEEVLSGSYKQISSEYQLVMLPNQQAFDRLGWNLQNAGLASGSKYEREQIAYYGTLSPVNINTVVYENQSSRYSLRAFQDGGNKYVAVTKTEARSPMICNDDLSFYNCVSSAPAEPEEVVAILAKKGDTVTDRIYNLFPKVSNDSMAAKIVEEALDELSREKMDLVLDTPFTKVTDGQAPAHLLSARAEHQAINQIIDKDASYFPTKIEDIVYSPSAKSDYDLVFKFKGERKLNPGESFYLVLPEEFSKLPLANVILGHRQNPRDQRGRASYNPRTGVKIYDDYPAYTSVQVHSVNHPYKDSWRTWGGPVSSDKGSKFAEIKDSPEFDNLYEWPLKGHKSLRTGQLEKSPVAVDMIKIEVLGSDPAYIDSVGVKVIAPRANNYVDISYTRSQTFMGDPITLAGRRYGGGQHFGGTFPGAHRLSPSRWFDAELEIPLNGETIKSVSVAAGDTKPDGVRNRDGGTGTPGAARISIIIEGIDGSETTLVDEENVGPQGVITGYTDAKGIPAKAIIIKGHRDTSYVMGIQYGHN